MKTRAIGTFLYILSSGALCNALQLKSDYYSQPDFVGNALSWYSEWKTQGSVVSRQRCQGYRSGGSYEFRCDPLGVTVSVVVDSSTCFITSMKPMVSGELSGYPTATTVGGNRRTCGELPAGDGFFNVQIVLPDRRKIDESLTHEAMKRAADYFRGTNKQGCQLYFPLVRYGDPFFHVYRRCHGMLEDVWEFVIRGGKPDNFAQWTYTRGRLPAGAVYRITRPDLWSLVQSDGVVRRQKR